MDNINDGKLELLSDKNSCLLLVDYQSSMFKGVGSGDKPRIRNAAICAAKAAKILDIPVVMSAISPKSNGEFIKEISDLFPRNLLPGLWFGLEHLLQDRLQTSCVNGKMR